MLYLKVHLFNYKTLMSLSKLATYGTTVVGKWSVEEAQECAEASIYHRMSFNFVLIEQHGWKEEIFPRTCVFMITASKSSYVRVKYKKKAAFAHIVVKRACGNWVPR